MQLGFFDIEKRHQQLNKLKDPLLVLSSLIDFEMFRCEIEKCFEKEHKDNSGRKPFDKVMLFKALLLKRLYALSFEELEFQITDRSSFRRFLKLNENGYSPDEKTFWLFSDGLAKNKVIDNLFLNFDEFLNSQGYTSKQGSMIDASFVEVPKQRNTREENKEIKEGKIRESFTQNVHKLAQKDTDARWTKKGGGGNQTMGVKNRSLSEANFLKPLTKCVFRRTLKLVEGINSGDKAEIIQNAIGAFTNCMGVVGQLKSAIGNKIAEFSKDVDAKIYNEATQTYDNLGQIQDAGYKYETYVKAEMFDQANQEALKLNDLSTDMMQGKATGFAININDINVDEITNDNFEPTTVLQGGISKTEYPDVSTEVPNVQNSQTTDFGDSAIIASQISNAINSIMNNSQNASNLNVSDAPQFRASSNNLNTSIEAIKKAQTVQKNNLDTLLQKVTTAKNQEEYSKLLKEYAQQKEKYQKTQDLTAQLDYASQNKDYQGVTQTAKNYMQQDSGMQPANQKLTKEHYNNKLETLINNALGFQPASAEEVPTGFASGTGNVSKSSNKIPNELKKLNAVKDKFIIDQATNIGRRTGSFASGSVKNSSELWQYASQNKVIDKENVQEFSNIDQISNSNLNKFVHNKVQQQLHMNDVKGLIFKPTSSLSNLIKNSRDMHKFISDNYAKLSQGKNLQSSIKLDYNIDDWGAINRADIYNPTIDKNGTFKAVIVDTYDFNKGELNPLVKAGRNVQEAGLLKPFYSICFVEIKKNELQHILNVYKTTNDLNMYKNPDLYYNLIKLINNKGY